MPNSANVEYDSRSSLLSPIPQLMLKTTLSVLCITSLVCAQSPRATAGWAFPGANCATPTAGLNDNFGTLRTGTLTNEYAFGWKATQATTLVGFQLYTRANTLPSA